jgi:hypothetical protein
MAGKRSKIVKAFSYSALFMLCKGPFPGGAAAA